MSYINQILSTTKLTIPINIPRMQGGQLGTSKLAHMPKTLSYQQMIATNVVIATAIHLLPLLFLFLQHRIYPLWKRL